MNFERKEEFKSAKDIKQIFDISASTLRNYSDIGKIETIRSPGGKRFYNISDVRKLFGEKRINKEENEGVYCYARVSSKKQQEDLVRQVEYLKSKKPFAKIIFETGSGLNYHRKGFQSLIKEIIRGKCKEVVLTYRDRLCRYGFEMFEFLCQEFGVKILVLNEDIKNDESEFARDIIDICNYYVANYNGKKSAFYREQKQNLKNQENKSEDS